MLVNVLIKFFVGLCNFLLHFTGASKFSTIQMVQIGLLFVVRVLSLSFALPIIHHFSLATSPLAISYTRTTTLIIIHSGANIRTKKIWRGNWKTVQRVGMIVVTEDVHVHLLVPSCS